jgi:hypothetical protein
MKTLPITLHVYTFVQITLNDTHRLRKLARLLKALSSINDMSLYCKSL